MPKSITMDLRCVLALVAALAVAAMLLVCRGYRAGSRRGPSLDHRPWYQVALVRAGLPAVDHLSGQFCGGSVRDDRVAQHIITAAHCVFDNSARAPGATDTPAEISTSSPAPRSLANEGAPRPARARGADLLTTPSFNEVISSSTTGRVLTLPAPRRCSCRRRSSRSRWSATRAWAATLPGAPLFVTGWGSTAAGTGPVISLRGVQVKNVSQHDVQRRLSEQTSPADPVRRRRSDLRGRHQQRRQRTPAQGDSGGPLVKANGRRVSTRGRRAGRDRLLRRRPAPAVPTSRACTPRWPSPRSGPFSRSCHPPAAPTNTSAPHAGRSRGELGQQADLFPRRVDGRTHVLPYQFVRLDRRRRHRRRRDRGAAVAYVVNGRGRGDRAALRGLRRQPRRRRALASSAPKPPSVPGPPPAADSAAESEQPLSAPRTATRPSLA